MTDLNALLDQIPVGDIAEKLGVDEKTAEAAVKHVLPGLVGGLAANAKDTKGAASLEKALVKHKATAPRGLKDIDTDDGEKIVANVFGSHTDQVATKLAASATKSTSGDVTGDLIKKILPIVAPIVLSFLAQQFLSGKTGSGSSTSTVPAAPAAPASSASSGGGIGDLLGGLLSGPQGKEIAGGVLGGLLGGGKK